MTANEARRALNAFMSAPMDDLSSQITAITALFIMTAELQRAVAARDAQIDEQKRLVSALNNRVSQLETELRNLRLDVQS